MPSNTIGLEQKEIKWSRSIESTTDRVSDTYLELEGRVCVPVDQHMRGQSEHE